MRYSEPRYRVFPNGCARKAGFSSFPRAERSRLKYDNAAEMHSYWCKRCLNWHLGHLPKAGAARG